jgi:hypothetical protein
MAEGFKVHLHGSGFIEGEDINERPITINSTYDNYVCGMSCVVCGICKSPDILKCKVTDSLMKEDTGIKFESLSDPSKKLVVEEYHDGKWSVVEFDFGKNMTIMRDMYVQMGIWIGQVMGRLEHLKTVAEK